MQKQAPSIGRILVAVGFALSCFALLLFLWVTFGGPVPFKPESYRFTADFPEAITLQKEAEVRIGGVTVGKVKQLSLAPESECHSNPATCNTTRATIEIEPQYAPISSDAEAILRQKTLLGETYIELTTGSQVQPVEAAGDVNAQSSAIDVGQISGDDAPESIPEGGHLDQTQVQDQTQIDEIFQGFDQQTRESFRLWMQGTALAVDGRGLDLNDAFGNLGPFASDASDVLGTLRQQEQSLRTLVHDTGDVFAALTEHDQALAGAIVGANRTFRGLASQSKALSDTFKIFPTFENESRLTLDRLKTFSHEAQPVFHDLRPVARNLRPTLRDVRTLAPHASRLFNDLNPLIDASKTGLPSLASFLRELRPLMVSLDPFLSNFNPLVRFIDYQAPVVTDFLGNIAAGTAGYLPGDENPGQASPRHLSRQMSIFTAETLSIHQERLSTNRGNGYLQPFELGNPYSASQAEVFPSHDCNNTFNYPVNEGVVTHSPPSVPAPQEDSGQFPFSSLFNPMNPNQVGPNFPGGTAASPGPSSYAACTIPPNFPALFGGGRVPEIFPDP
jgi:phospholipid/cholesterol/gamma-HCH transport system substrate-binding protein